MSGLHLLACFCNGSLLQTGDCHTLIPALWRLVMMSLTVISGFFLTALTLFVINCCCCSWRLFLVRCLMLSKPVDSFCFTSIRNSPCPMFPQRLLFIFPHFLSPHYMPGGLFRDQYVHLYERLPMRWFVSEQNSTTNWNFFMKFHDYVNQVDKWWLLIFICMLSPDDSCLSFKIACFPPSSLVFMFYPF